MQSIVHRVALALFLGLGILMVVPTEADAETKVSVDLGRQVNNYIDSFNPLSNFGFALMTRVANNVLNKIWPKPDPKMQMLKTIMSDVKQIKHIVSKNRVIMKRQFKKTDALIISIMNSMQENEAFKIRSKAEARFAALYGSGSIFSNIRNKDDFWEGSVQDWKYPPVKTRSIFPSPDAITSTQSERSQQSGSWIVIKNGDALTKNNPLNTTRFTFKIENNDAVMVNGDREYWSFVDDAYSSMHPLAHKPKINKVVFRNGQLHFKGDGEKLPVSIGINKVPDSNYTRSDFDHAIIKHTGEIVAYAQKDKSAGHNQKPWTQQRKRLLKQKLLSALNKFEKDNATGDSINKQIKNIVKHWGDDEILNIVIVGDNLNHSLHQYAHFMKQKINNNGDLQLLPDTGRYVLKNSASGNHLDIGYVTLQYYQLYASARSILFNLATLLQIGYYYNPTLITDKWGMKITQDGSDTLKTNLKQTFNSQFSRLRSTFKKGLQSMKVAAHTKTGETSKYIGQFNFNAIPGVQHDLKPVQASTYNDGMPGISIPFFSREQLSKHDRENIRRLIQSGNTELMLGDENSTDGKFYQYTGSKSLGCSLYGAARTQLSDSEKNNSEPKHQILRDECQTVMNKNKGPAWLHNARIGNFAQYLVVKNAFEVLSQGGENYARIVEFTLPDKDGHYYAINIRYHSQDKHGGDTYRDLIVGDVFYQHPDIVSDYLKNVSPITVSLPGGEWTKHCKLPEAAFHKHKGKMLTGQDVRKPISLKCARTEKGLKKADHFYTQLLVPGKCRNPNTSRDNDKLSEIKIEYSTYNDKRGRLMCDTDKSKYIPSFDAHMIKEDFGGFTHNERVTDFVISQNGKWFITNLQLDRDNNYFVKAGKWPAFRTYLTQNLVLDVANPYYPNLYWSDKDKSAQQQPARLSKKRSQQQLLESKKYTLQVNKGGYLWAPSPYDTTEPLAIRKPDIAKKWNKSLGLCLADKKCESITDILPILDKTRDIQKKVHGERKYITLLSWDHHCSQPFFYHGNFLTDCNGSFYKISKKDCPSYRLKNIKYGSEGKVDQPLICATKGPPSWLKEELEKYGSMEDLKSWFKKNLSLKAYKNFLKQHPKLKKLQNLQQWVKNHPALEPLHSPLAQHWNKSGVITPAIKKHCLLANLGLPYKHDTVNFYCHPGNNDDKWVKSKLKKLTTGNAYRYNNDGTVKIFKPENTGWSMQCPAYDYEQLQGETIVHCMKHIDKVVKHKDDHFHCAQDHEKCTIAPMYRTWYRNGLIGDNIPAMCDTSAFARIVNQNQASGITDKAIALCDQLNDEKTRIIGTNSKKRNKMTLTDVGEYSDELKHSYSTYSVNAQGNVEKVHESVRGPYKNKAAYHIARPYDKKEASKISAMTESQFSTLKLQQCLQPPNVHFNDNKLACATECKNGKHWNGLQCVDCKKEYDDKPVWYPEQHKCKKSPFQTPENCQKQSYKAGTYKAECGSDNKKVSIKYDHHCQKGTRLTFNKDQGLKCAVYKSAPEAPENCKKRIFQNGQFSAVCGDQNKRYSLDYQNQCRFGTRVIYNKQKGLQCAVQHDAPEVPGGCSQPQYHNGIYKAKCGSENKQSHIDYQSKCRKDSQLIYSQKKGLHCAVPAADPELPDNCHDGLYKNGIYKAICGKTGQQVKLDYKKLCKTGSPITYKNKQLQCMVPKDRPGLPSGCNNIVSYIDGVYKAHCGDNDQLYKIDYKKQCHASSRLLYNKKHGLQCALVKGAPSEPAGCTDALYRNGVYSAQCGSDNTRVKLEYKTKCKDGSRVMYGKGFDGKYLNKLSDKKALRCTILKDAKTARKHIWTKGEDSCNKAIYRDGMLRLHCPVANNPWQQINYQVRCGGKGHVVKKWGHFSCTAKETPKVPIVHKRMYSDLDKSCNYIWKLETKSGNMSNIVTYICGKPHSAVGGEQIQKIGYETRCKGTSGGGRYLITEKTNNGPVLKCDYDHLNPKVPDNYPDGRCYLQQFVNFSNNFIAWCRSSDDYTVNDYSISKDFNVNNSDSLCNLPFIPDWLSQCN